MILSEAKVMRLQGTTEARHLKPGDEVYSWDTTNWRRNEIAKVIRGQARRTYSIFCFDGVGGLRLRCDGQQRFSVGRKKPKADELTAGKFLNVSEGAHVFKAEVGAIEMLEQDEPEATVGFELERGPHNILVDGFLCHSA